MGEENIFPRNLGRDNCLQGDARLISKLPDHHFRGAVNIPLANDEIKITVLPHCGIAVTSLRERWPFDCQRADASSFKVFEQTKQLRCHAQSEGRLRALPFAEPLLNLARNRGLLKATQLLV